MNIDELISQAPVEYQVALKEEKQTYRRIHEITQTVLSEIGIETKNKQIISILESTGLAGYDESTGRIYLLPELIDQSIDSAARTYPGDEGMNTLGIGGIPPFLYRESGYFMYARRHALSHPAGWQPGLLPAFDVIRRIGSGDYYTDYHTTANISVYDQ